METCNREFNEIYKKYKNLVLKVAYTNSGNNYDAADDISQEIFLKLYENFDSLNSERVGGWLSKTARNSAINFRKKYGRESHESLCGGLRGEIRQGTACGRRHLTFRRTIP